jgi:hypothetical protein
LFGQELKEDESIMLNTVRATLTPAGTIIFDEAVHLTRPTAVLVTLLDEGSTKTEHPTAPQQNNEAAPPQLLTGDAVVDHYQPRTELGRKLIELRRAYIEEGGKLMSWDEINAEVLERRGGVADD